MRRFFLLMHCLCIMLFTSGCTTYVGYFWERSKALLEYAKVHTEKLFFSEEESRLIASRQAFFGYEEEEFIPLDDTDSTTQKVDPVAPQPREIPGSPDGKLPGIESFHAPSSEESKVFPKIYFDTDQHVPNTKASYESLKKLANYLKKHKNTYIFIEGHCDERASEAYNQSLGTRRCHYIRNFLIQHGVNPNQLYTISYGKERPEILGHGEKAWRQNRRVMFKIYQERITL